MNGVLRQLRAAVLTLAAVVAAASCVYYEPVPLYTTSTYERAWSASLGALSDVGVSVVSTDAASGTIRGTKDGVDVTVSVVRQPDGRTRVQFDARRSDRDPALPGRFSEAYERRMGR